ncbi:MAG: UbiD family decarboxylase, partial [Candidatus Parcubacteria bacterium]|nr:UbiD family decarboxylase [Burkholderiales bacterium]
MEFRKAVKEALKRREAVPVDAITDYGDMPARIAEEERGENRALYFSRGPGVAMDSVGNLFGSPGRICRALEAQDYAQLFTRLDAAIDKPSRLQFSGKPGDGMLRTDAPDLTTLLPSIRHSADDATPYLTSGILLARYPGTRRHHACFVRMSLSGGNRLVVNPATRHVRQIVEQSVGRGDPLEVAVLVGAPTEIVFMACVSVPDGCDKLEVAQALAGGGISFSDDTLSIPHGTEFVLRGKVLPDYEREGPVGDQKGLYSVKERNPVCVVETLWARPDPVFHAIAGGVSREHIELVTLGPRAVLERIARSCPSILRYELPRFAGGRLAVLVVADGFDPASIAERLWDISSVRGFIAVNGDVDAASAGDVLWAVVERAKVETDFRFSAGVHAATGAR